MKKTIAFLLVAAMLLASTLAASVNVSALHTGSAPSAGEVSDESGRGINTGVTIDSDPAGGYAGDYVVIYNPGSASESASTGSLAGKVVTDLTANVLPARSAEPADRDIPFVIDVDREVSLSTPDEPAPVFEEARADYAVGSTRSFGLYNYPPVSGETDFTFKLLYIGEHCRIWTPVVSDYHPLDLINTDYAHTAADRFDEKFELMQASYGDFYDISGDGRVELLFYDIGDGWQPGQGYVAGYFWQDDYRYNNAAMLHVDTYPGVAYTNSSGVYVDHFDSCFGTIVHEFQHCINYAQNPDGMATWLNEGLSGSAEELCFPGSGLSERIFSWHDQKLTTLSEIQNPPVEYEYDPGFGLHTGGSITAWDSTERDYLARYAEVMFFTQYLYTRYGSTDIYKKIIDANEGSDIEDSINAVLEATGWTAESLWQDFFIRMVANDPESGYGFRMNEGYDPEEYWGLESLYSLLSPVVYTSENAADIYGGGFITVKPVGGVFTLPSDASPSLRCAGVTIGEVGLEGIEITPAETEMLLDETAKLVVARTPVGANNYEMVWTSSDESVATVTGNRFSAVVTSRAPGAVTITANATDKQTGTVYTASALVTVADGQSYTKYVPVNTIETGREYMIGQQYGDDVYVLMNYNPNPPENGYYGLNNYYVNTQLTEYSYGIRAVLNDEGEITGLDTSAYPDAAVRNAEWLFYDADEGYYYIRSAYNRSYHLRVANYDAYSGLYPQDGQSYAYKWVWDETGSGLYYAFKTNVKKYVTFIPSVNGFTNLFCAPNSPNSIRLYKKETGVIMNGDSFTVTFRDWDGAVLKTERVEAGSSASAPDDPVREGFTFTGWDVDFSNVTGDLVVTAQYSVNSYRLTIDYVYEDGSAAAESFVGEYVYNTAYSVESPEIPGFVPDRETVFGTMPANDVGVTVTYTRNGPAVSLLGDVNCDGKVDMSDISALSAYLLGVGQVTEQGLVNADASLNGAVDSSDLSAVFALI
ncbi:MAG: Ig-like domain-containing protein [Clostridia bacterium]|nr:Ig-like domain-containing protein [Clostridia bacterium]